MVDVDDLVKRAPTVISSANPDPVDLLQARADVRSNKELRDLFLQQLPIEVLVDRLATALSHIWPSGDPGPAAQYLVDEYSQLDAKGILIISEETGRALAVLTEDDLYTPALVPRDNGNLAQPLPVIRPELHGALVMAIHDEKREAAALEALKGKSFLRGPVVDLALQAATKLGRKQITKSLGSEAPQELLGVAGGAAGTFLRKFLLVEEPVSEPDLTYLSGKVAHKSVKGVQDALTTNLRYHQVAMLRVSMAQGWVRELARSIVLQIGPFPQEVLDLQRFKDLPTGDLWIGPPDMVRPLKQRLPSTPILAVEGLALACCVAAGPLGYLKVPDASHVANGEFFDRWEVKGTLEFEVWINSSKLRLFQVVGADPQVQVLL